MSTDRPNVPTESTDAVLHRRQLADRTNASLTKDGSNGMVAPLRLMSYIVATLPDPTLWTGSEIYVSDEVGGGVPAWSDGVNWRRVSDGAIVS